MADAEKDLVQLSRLLERHVGRSANSAPPPMLRAGQQLFSVAGRRACIVDVLAEIVQDPAAVVLERRLRKCLAVARL